MTSRRFSICSALAHRRIPFLPNAGINFLTAQSSTPTVTSSWATGPLFTHQYSQAWLYLAALRDGPPYEIDYFRNSVTATYADRAYCLSLRGIYPGYSEYLWGTTASDSDIGYVIWGDPFPRRDLDGTVVPCVAGGSLMFAPEICLPALRYMHENFAAQYIYGRYGFADAFQSANSLGRPRRGRY